MDRPNKNVARGEATRSQLIVIATRSFADRGYEDTSIEAVLREAGVSRGSLYHHFASKDVLYAAVLARLVEDVGAAISQTALYREAAALADVRVPDEIRADVLVDGRIWDGQDPAAYLDGFAMRA